MNKNKITSIILATTMLLETVPVVNAYDDVDLNDTSISIENIENEEENYLDKDSTNPIDATDATQNNDIDNSNNTNSDSLEEPDFDINDFIDNSNINNNELGGVVDSDYMREEVKEDVVQDEESQDIFLDKEEIDISITNDNDLTTENYGQAKSNVLEITLADGEYVPDLTNNPDGYETIVVKTTGNKKLVSTDYNRLRTSKIPNIDLSQAISDSIPASAFKDATHLKTFKFPKEFNTIQGASIGDRAFLGCSNLTGNLIIPDSITHIGYAAFYKCSGLNGNLIIPNSVTSIGEFAFESCSGFTGNLVIPDSVTSIGKCAFRDCSGFNGNLIIPNSVTYIGDYAFKGCSGFTGNLIIPDSVTSIGDYAFAYCSGFTGNLIIPDSITSIGDYAFAYCSGFTGNLIIPNSVTSIGNSAFERCSGFTGNLIIPDSVTSIGSFAFDNCSGFTGNLIIPDSVTSIEKFAFYNCRGLNGNLIIPNSVTYIDDYAFAYCSGFTGNLIIPDSITSIGNYTFALCSGFTGNLIIPDSVTSIGNYAFHSCSGFTGNLIIPDSVETIGTNPFYSCSNIQNFIFRINESFEDINYRKDVFDSLNKNKTIIEMSYDFDTSGTWLDTLDAKNIGKPILKSEIQTDNGESLSTSLYIPTPYQEDNVIVLKDGENYKLRTKTSDGKYVFNEEGSYNITLTTDLGTVSNIDFELAAVLINKPTINYENNLVSIVDNGNNAGDYADRIEYRINGGQWLTYTGEFRIPDEFVNGVDGIKVEARVIVKDKVSKATEYSISIPKAQINVENVEITQGDNFDEYGIVSATDIDGTDISDRVTVVSSDVKTDTPGEYTVIYKVEASNGYFTEKEIKVTVLKKKIPPIIEVEDIIVEKDNKFDPLDFITVTDADGNLIDKTNVEIIENTVNISVPGIYTITFRIIDDNGLTSIETTTVTVKESMVSNGSGGNENNDSNKNDTNTENNNNINDKNNGISKIPNAGGFASLIHLLGLTAIAGSYSILRKRKND